MRFNWEKKRFYTHRKPSRQEIIDILNKHGIKCTNDWFKPCNSGLVTVRSVEVEPLED